MNDPVGIYLKCVCARTVMTKPGSVRSLAPLKDKSFHSVPVLYEPRTPLRSRLARTHKRYRISVWWVEVLGTLSKGSMHVTGQSFSPSLSLSLCILRALAPAVTRRHLVSTLKPDSCVRCQASVAFPVLPQQTVTQIKVCFQNAFLPSTPEHGGRERGQRFLFLWLWNLNWMIFLSSCCDPDE